MYSNDYCAPDALICGDCIACVEIPLDELEFGYSDPDHANDINRDK